MDVWRGLPPTHQLAHFSVQSEADTGKQRGKPSQLSPVAMLWPRAIRSRESTLPASPALKRATVHCHMPKMGLHLTPVFRETSKAEKRKDKRERGREEGRKEEREGGREGGSQSHNKLKYQHPS